MERSPPRKRSRGDSGHRDRRHPSFFVRNAAKISRRTSHRLTRQIGITQTEAIERHAHVVTNDVDGEETTAIGKAGLFVTLTNGALQEIQIKLRKGGEDGAEWKAIHAIAAFTTEPESTCRLSHKPLDRGEKAIMDLLPAKHEHEPAAGRQVPDARGMLRRWLTNWTRGARRHDPGPSPRPLARPWARRKRSTDGYRSRPSARIWSAALA